MQETFSGDDIAELAVLERNGFIESRHFGAAIMLDPDGEVLATHGNPRGLVLPRSSLKPMQAVASITAGADLSLVERGLSTASHCGSDAHVSVVRGMLTSAGLSENDLACPPALPSDTAAHAHFIRERLEPARIRMNCSGKHAAMLKACVAAGWSTKGYLNPDHPLQQHIVETVERLIDEKLSYTAIDGCGAPVFAMSLAGLARGIHRIGSASLTSQFAFHRTAAQIVEAVREEPWTIDGPGRPDTTAIETLGVFAKGGAEGVMVMVAPGGTTVALKTIDGSGRAATLVAAAMLHTAGAISTKGYEELQRRLPLAVLGGGREVGRIRVSPTLA
jgi:L-asparaginase II